MRSLFVTPIIAAIAFGLAFLAGLSAADLSSTPRAIIDSAPEPTPASATIPLPAKNSPYHSVYQSSIKGYNRPVPSVDERLAPLPKHRLNVKEFGAKGDGRSDDTLAIRRALATARSAGGATVYFPAGTYNFAPQPTDKGWTPETFKSGDPYAVFDLSFSNVALVGDGPKKSVLSFHTLGLTDPVTHYSKTGSSYVKIKRGAAFFVYGGANGAVLTNIQFKDIRVTGNAPGTGDATVGGIPSNGDGWDVTNKGLWISGPVPVDNVILNNVEFDGFRGEILYYGGNGKRVTILNSYLHDSNADAISMSADVYVANTRIAQSYNGFENLAANGIERTVIVNSLIDGYWGKSKTHNGVVFIGVGDSGLYLTGCTIQNCANGVYLAEFADNITIQGNLFSDDGIGIFWKAFNLYPKISKVHYNNTWIDANLFQAPNTHQGQVIYDPISRDTPQHNLVISNNTITQLQKFFVDSSDGITPEYRSNFEIFGNRFMSGRLWEGVGPAGNRALWHDNDLSGIDPEAANNYSHDPVVVDIDPPGAPILRVNAFWSAGSTISLAKSVHLYPTGFELTVVGPLSHGHTDQQISIRPDPSWNHLGQSYSMSLNAKLVLKKDSSGRFSFENYTPGTGW
jgi:hypothetical protein